MKTLINCLLIFFIVLSISSKGLSRTLAGKFDAQNDTAIAKKLNVTATDVKVNGTELMTLEKLEQPENPVVNGVIKHIKRDKRELLVTMPFDQHTMHLPCDLDQRGRHNIVSLMPNHCIWVWNNKFSHVGFYRVFKIYQLEGFFFGQYYERLKRYEIDPHTWGYG
ncbi:uncharacterized protein LOC119549389 [Drosophila subpulchrella]|uniref:uncharacterized protein LOC119549389 n=1 Tax=Drosophila subpulchrella TaxID=1486046 RepID=UPI0018A1905C|nr:uncharacterized protein LOC119549389 [Drosophila subpulchrella]